MALMAALTLCLHHVAGFTNKSLRPVVATLLDRTYTASQMTYDLRRLRGKGLIRRVEGTHTSVLTSEGIRAAMFFTKTDRRIIDPLFAAQSTPSPDPELRSAMATIDRFINDRAQEVGIAT